MAEIRFKPVKITKPGVKGGKQFKWHARPSRAVKFSPADVWQQMKDVHSLSPNTSESAINAFFETVLKFSSYGAVVPAGMWGHFRTSLISEGVDDPRDLTENHIKTKKVLFYPSKYFKKRANALGVSKIEDSYVVMEHDDILEDMKGKK